MFVQLVLIHDYSAYSNHVDNEESATKIPFGHFHDQVMSDGAHGELYTTVAECLNRWSTHWDDETRPVLITLPEEIEFHLNLMGVKDNFYLVYDIESGEMALSDQMQEAARSIRNKNSGRAHGGSNIGRGMRTGGNKTVPFFDFTIKHPNDGVEPFLMHVDREMGNEIAAGMARYIEHALYDNFTNVIDIVYTSFLDDMYTNFDNKLENYEFKEEPLIKYNTKRNNRCGFSDINIEMFMHVLRENNKLFMKMKKEEPSRYIRLKKLMDLIQYELDMGLSKD